MGYGFFHFIFYGFYLSLKMFFLFFGFLSIFGENKKIGNDMSTFVNKCPFCGKTNFLSQDTFTFQGATYSIIRCTAESCQKLIVSEKSDTEQRMKDVEEQLERMEEYRNKVQDKASILISELEQQDNSLISIKNDIISSVKQTESPKTISSEDKIQSATPSTDIYGGKLTDRLSDIYYCIHAAAEEMAKQMVAMPEPSEEGLLELEILFAGVISHYINQHIVIQALLSGNSKFFEIEASNLGGAMEHYKNSFESQILCTHIKERTPLLEFAKKNGKLKLIDLKGPDKGGYLKAPVFVSNNNDVIICRFYFFDKDEQTSDFIIANKNYIYIDRTDEDVYLFKLKRDIDWWYDEFMKYIAYYIYASPLNYHYYLHGDEIEEGIKNIKRGKTNVVVATDINKIKACDFEETSNILPSISYALNEGIRTLDVLASSTGLIGEYNS